MEEETASGRSEGEEEDAMDGGETERGVQRGEGRKSADPVPNTVPVTA